MTFQNGSKAFINIYFGFKQIFQRFTHLMSLLLSRLLGSRAKQKSFMISDVVPASRDVSCLLWSAHKNITLNLVNWKNLSTTNIHESPGRKCNGQSLYKCGDERTECHKWIYGHFFSLCYLQIHSERAIHFQVFVHKMQWNTRTSKWVSNLKFLI